MALAADTNLVFEIGERSTVPVKASAQIYTGAAVGFTSGYARGLVAGDAFAGFALENKLGTTDGVIKCAVTTKGRVQLAITSAAVTDIHKAVYASADGTFTFTATSNSRVGTVVRWVSTGVVIVEFRVSSIQSLAGVDALTDNSGGASADGTIAAGPGIFTLAIPLQLAAMTTAAADLMTAYVPGYKFKLLAVSFVTTLLGTGTSASQVLNLEIGTTNVTGGVLTLLLADTDTLGKKTDATAITAANTGSSSDTISIEVAASGTVFTAGAGVLLIRIQNMDVADAVTELATKVNAIISALP